jgi:hypothetical protein
MVKENSRAHLSTLFAYDSISRTIMTLVETIPENVPIRPNYIIYLVGVTIGFISLFQCTPVTEIC